MVRMEIIDPVHQNLKVIEPLLIRGSCPNSNENRILCTAHLMQYMEVEHLISDLISWDFF